MLNGTAYTLLPNGQRQSLSRYDSQSSLSIGSTTTTTYTYDTADRLTQSTDTDSTGTSITTTYTWDLNGRLSQKATPSQITQYTWRSDDRLIQVQQGSTQNTLQTLATYQYDDHGNRTERTAWVIDPSNPTGPRIPQTTNYLIDETYTYAETLEETQTSSAGQTTTTHYTWDDSNHLQSATTTPNGSTSSTGPNSPTETWYEQDGLGNVITLSTPTGQLNTRYTYSAFGDSVQSWNAIGTLNTGLTTTTTDSNPYRYTGEYADAAIALQYNRARWYDGGVGRFITMDGFSGVDARPGTLPKYLYAEDNAAIGRDPSGLQNLEEEAETTEILGENAKIAAPQTARQAAGSAANAAGKSAENAVFNAIRDCIKGIERVEIERVAERLYTPSGLAAMPDFLLKVADKLIYIELNSLLKISESASLS